MCRMPILKAVQRDLALALAGGSLLVISTAASAHTDPAGSTATGVGISMTALRDTDANGIGDTPVLGGATPVAGETIYYECTLFKQIAPNAAFEGGTISITPPSGGPTDVTPPPGTVPCIGGTADDPNNTTGDCAGAPAFITSNQLAYVVNCGDEGGDSDLDASCVYNSAAFAHITAPGSVADTPGVGANTSFPLGCQDCNVKVNKQISCSGAPGTFFDPTLVVNNEDGTLGPNCVVANPAGPVFVQYQVQNASEAALLDCVLTESNAAFGTEPAVATPILATTTVGPLNAGTNPTCQEAVTGGEPDNVQVTCTCGFATSGITDSARDDATLTCQVPSVKTDKRVDCGSGFVDSTLVAANEDLNNGCTALDGDPITYGYRSQNTGTAALFDCTLVDTNNLASPNPIVVGNIAVGAAIVNTPATNTPLCSEPLDALEPDTLTLTCCSVDVAAIINCPDANKVTAFDVADVTCNSSPELSVLKECIDANGDGIGEVTVTASATAADLNLVNCSATDTIFLGDPTCPAGPAGGTNIPLTPANPFGITAGGNQVLTGVTPLLSADACNTVSVTCTVDGQATPLPAETADAVCPAPGLGCLTRTPGFWGTHPHLISDELGDPRSLDLLPLDICGLTIDTTAAFDNRSTTEAICSVGQDGKLYAGGPQQAQLVRQCVAAQLNILATVEGGGNCSTSFPSATFFEDCCGAVSECAGDDIAGVSVASCINGVDAFNNAPDTIATFAPFNGPGPAISLLCHDSKNNGVIVQP